MAYMVSNYMDNIIIYKLSCVQCYMYGGNIISKYKIYFEANTFKNLQFLESDRFC